MESTSFRYGGINKFGTKQSGNDASLELILKLQFYLWETGSTYHERQEVSTCDKLKFKVTYAGWEGEKRAIKCQACADL